MRIFRVYELATTSLTGRNSWERAGFGIERRDWASYLDVHEGKIRGPTEFVEIWQID
jgi:hypothetical protein